MRRRVRLNETWRCSPVYGERYDVSSLGRVRNSETGKILKPVFSGKKGVPDYRRYQTVKLFRNGLSVRVYIHILVCTAFHGPKPSPSHEVNHKNTFKNENWEDNLEWTTSSENKVHAWENNLYPNREYKEFSAISPQGEKCRVRNINEFCRRRTLDPGTMSKVLNGKRSSHKGWRAA